MIEKLLQKMSANDRHVLKAVLGWIDLRDCAEALRELDNLSPELRSTPEIIDLEWQASARHHDWKRALETARTFTRLHPDVASGWIHLAYSLHELKRTVEARDQLLDARIKFPLNALILYNLACYCCQLNQNEDAIQWIQEAMAVRDRSEILSMALEDSDLEPIRDRLEQMV